jgi:hypothetical protein
MKQQGTRAKSVSAFLAMLPAERRTHVERVRDLILARLPAGYEEAVVKDMLVYQVPLARYPGTYNGQALWYVALGCGKSHLSLHLMPVYGSETLAAQLDRGFRAAGKKLDMGKACIRFTDSNELALDVIGDIVGAVPLERWVEVAKLARGKT